MRADGPARGHSRGSSALDNLVTAAREDKGEHLRLVALAGEVQRRHPILVGDPELEARLFAREHLGRLHVPAGDRDVQRRLPVLINLVQRSAGLDEYLEDLDVALLRRNVQ